jgi:hypothetical protein
MAVSSYADTTVGVVFFNIRPGEGDAIADRLAAAARDSREDPEARRRYETAVGAYLESHHLPLLPRVVPHPPGRRLSVALPPLSA